MQLITGREFRVFGHRGAAGLAPENTLLALETGIKTGANWMEFDVQLHPSGELLLCHDLTVDRTTNGRGVLADLTFDQLRALNAGLGQQLPTLTEALNLVDGRAGLNIELKAGVGVGRETANLLGDYVDKGWPVEKLLVSSFNLPELAEFKQAAPDIPISALLAGVPLDFAACASQLGAVAVCISSEFLDDRLLADADQRGLKVYVYTVNDPWEVLRLRVLGVDGIFTDYPDRALKALSQY